MSHCDFQEKKTIKGQRFFYGRFAILIVLGALLLGGCSTIYRTAKQTAQKKPGTQTAGRKAPAGTAGSGLPPAGSGRGGYYQDDGPMENTPENLLATPDAIPRVEPYSRAANRPYTIFGKTYVPFTDNRPYKEVGHGSWYGKKFHGNQTSSGEVYDMFQMTAAHTTMPIPSYARVTNVVTGQQVIVRVNDRGPFVAGRIIDLSYTAALKLGYLHQGSALLEVEHLLPDEIERINLARMQAPVPAKQSPPQSVVIRQEKTEPAVSPGIFPVPSSIGTIAGSERVVQSQRVQAFYLQLGAYRQMANAQTIQAEYSIRWAHVLPGVELVMTEDFYRLFAGPFHTLEEANYAASQIESEGFRPMVVRR